MKNASILCIIVALLNGCSAAIGSKWVDNQLIKTFVAETGVYRADDKDIDVFNEEHKYCTANSPPIASSSPHPLNMIPMLLFGNLYVASASQEAQFRGTRKCLEAKGYVLLGTN